MVIISDGEGHVLIEGEILSIHDVLSEEKAIQIWPHNECSICSHLFSDDYLLMLKVGEASPNCQECDARPRARTLPMLMHYLQPLTSRIFGGELLAFAKTGVEGKCVDPSFSRIRSASLYGNYSGNHEIGVDIRDLSRYSTGQFCGTFSSLLFDYFPEHDKALSELSRVIIPGGLLITHIANYRLLEGDEEPYEKSQIKAKEDAFQYLGKETIPDIMVGRNWFFNAIERNGFNPGLISIRDSITGEYFLWYLGVRKGQFDPNSIVSAESDALESSIDVTELSDEPPLSSCCVCGTPASEFEEFNNVENRRCPECGSVERTRAVLNWLSNNTELEGADIFAVAPASSATKFILGKKPESFDRCDVRPHSGYEFQADITNMPVVKSESYDFAMTIKVLEHCADDDAAISELCRILRPGGRLLINGDISSDMDTRILSDPAGYYGKDNLEEFNIGTFRKYGLSDLKVKLEQYFKVNVVLVTDKPTGYEGFLLDCIKSDNKESSSLRDETSAKERFLIITVDTEAQPPRQSEDHVQRLIYGRSKKGDFGIGEMMDIADRNSKKISFFVDFIAELLYPGEIQAVCEDILNRGHDVQLHAHPEFAAVDFWEELGIAREGSMNHWNYEQASKVLSWMMQKCSDWGLPTPVGIRGGGYRYNMHLLHASADSGLTLDFNYNHLHRKIPLNEITQPQPFNIGPLPMFQWSNGLYEVPVSTIRMEEDFAKTGSRKRFDEYFIRNLKEGVYEKMYEFFDETKGPGVLIMLLHSWSFLGFNQKKGYYEFDNLGKRDAFDSFLANLPEDIQVITVRELHDKIAAGEIEPLISIDTSIADYDY